MSAKTSRSKHSYHSTLRENAIKGFGNDANGEPSLFISANHSQSTAKHMQAGYKVGEFQRRKKS